jgi:hypothetical protein
MTTESSVPSDTDNERDDQREQIVSYLVTKADHGSFQCKSTFLAEELDIPAWDVTQMMADIDDSVSELDVEELTYSRSTTWRVTYDPC